MCIRDSAVAGVGAAAAVAVSSALLAFTIPKAVGSRSFWSSHGSHLGFACIVLGVAVSGPFQKSMEANLSPGQSISLEGYDFTYTRMRQFKTSEMSVDEAIIKVTKDGKIVGELTP